MDMLRLNEGAMDVIDRKLVKPDPLGANATAEEKKVYREQKDSFRKSNLLCQVNDCQCSK